MKWRKTANEVLDILMNSHYNNLAIAKSCESEDDASYINGKAFAYKNAAEILKRRIEEGDKEDEEVNKVLSKE